MTQSASASRRLIFLNGIHCQEKLYMNDVPTRGRRDSRQSSEEKIPYIVSAMESRMLM